MSQDENPLPDPPIGREVDLRELYPYMPLRVSQLISSDTWILATGDEAKACVTLWCQAWHQVPAGSIPNNDKILAVLSGAGSNWPTVKRVALRGFAEHSDGRLYHERIVEKAIKAWGKHKERAKSGRKGAANRWKGKRKLHNGLASGSAIAEPELSQCVANGIEEKKREDRKKTSPNGEAKERRRYRLPAEFRRPDEWLPDATAARARHNLPAVDMELAWEMFFNWTQSGSEHAIKTDWHKTWINWALKAEPPRFGNRQPSPDDPMRGI